MSGQYRNIVCFRRIYVSLVFQEFLRKYLREYAMRCVSRKVLPSAAKFGSNTETLPPCDSRENAAGIASASKSNYFAGTVMTSIKDIYMADWLIHLAAVTSIVVFAHDFRR